mgnify:CR=1 FL=1
MEVLTTDEALKTLKGSSARPFHSDVLDTEEAIKILRAHSQVEKREPKVYTVSKPQEPRTYHRNADGLMTQVGAQPTAKQQKQAENAARLDALAGRTGAQKDPPAPIGRPQMQSYTSQREGVAMQLPQIDQWNANAAMPAVKELAGKAVNMGTNILFPLKGMKQGVDLLTGKMQSTFDPEAERQALSQMGAVQRGVERVAGGLNSIVETPAAALRYAGETAVQAGKNLAENFQKDGYGDRLSEAVYRKIKNQLTETAFDPVLLKYVSVPIGTPPGKVHEAYLKLQEEKGTAILVKFTEVLKPMTNLYLTATTTDSVSMLATFIPLILMIVIFYFLLIRPQKKRDKEVQKMRENIEIADEIVTIGGIIGRVVSIKDDTVVIETASDHSKIRMARWSIQQNITATERAAQEQQAKKEEK